MLKSPRFATSQRLQKSADNNPPMRWPETGDAVAIVQQAFLDLGFAMPQSIRKSGGPDGIFGTETVKVVREFQSRHKLGVDGVVGRQTLTKLDELLPSGPTPKPEELVPYKVPGLKSVIAQPSPMSCWATVYTMMRCWKQQQSLEIRAAVLAVGQKWADYYDLSYPPTRQGLPPNEFGPFLQAARMTHQPMINLTIDEWARMLRRYGLLWIGAAIKPEVGSGLHSRIVEGIHGNGKHDGTFMEMIDPDGGKRYNEAFMTFLGKYEAGIRSVGGEYFQIRHFPA